MLQEKNLTMKDLPESERPYEKLERLGPGVLSDAELLAVLLRSGTRGERVTEVASRALAAASAAAHTAGANDPLSALLLTPLEELSKLRGIGRVHAIQLKAVLEISIRIASAKALEHVSFQDPASVADFCMESMRYLEQETVRVLYFNNRGMLLADKTLSVGTIQQALVCTRDIMAAAMACKAVYFIILHNHPSGDPTPSREDIETTQRLAEAGQLMEVRLLDHIVIGNGIYYSMKEHGHLHVQDPL